MPEGACEKPEEERFTMDNFLRDLIYKRIPLGKGGISVLELLLGVCITGVGVMLRGSVAAYTPVDAFKLLTMGLDFVMAILGAAFVWGRTGSRNRAVLTYALMVIWPVFVANSALWGRRGAFCGVLLVIALYAYDRKMRYVSAAAILGGVFLAALELPGAGTGEFLTLGWPNVFELTGKFMFVDLYEKVSRLFVAGILLCMVYCVKKKGLRLGRRCFLPFLLFLALFLPYFLPFMPAWAGYGADVLAVLLAVVEPKKFYVAFLHLIVSYSSYAFVLNGESKLPMPLYSVILLGLLLDVGAYTYRLMTEETA